MAEPGGIKDLMTYFSTPDRPVSPAEFKTFWQDLTDDEKAWYKQEIGNILAES